jgi:hypothetical protein
MASTETDAVAATGTVYPGATNAEIPLSDLFQYYGQVSTAVDPDLSPANGDYQINSLTVQYFGVGVKTNDGSFIEWPNNQEYGYGNSALDIPIGELNQFYFVPSGSLDEVTEINFNAETADTSYRRPATSTVLGTGIIQGLDYKFSLNAGQAAAIADAGYKFVIRYYCSDNSEISLTQNEIQTLEGAGLQICTVWENQIFQVQNGLPASGASDAGAAIAKASAANQPNDTVIYFAVDGVYAQSTVQNYISGLLQYFNAPGNNSNGYVIGIYGSNETCDLAQTDGIKYLWDWSGLQSENINQVEQDSNYSNISNTDLTIYGDHYITSEDPTGALAVDSLSHHQITVDNSVLGIDIDVAKADTPFGAFGPVASPQPDLVVANGVHPTSSSVPEGGSVTVNYVLGNVGGTAAGPSTTAIVLSSTPTISDSDTVLQLVSSEAVPASGGDDSESTSVSLANVAPGSYYLGAIANYGGAVSESQTGSENNVNGGLPGTEITVTPPQTALTFPDGVLLRLRTY